MMPEKYGFPKEYQIYVTPVQELAKKISEEDMIKVTKKYGGNVIEFNPRFSTFEGHLFVLRFQKNS